VNAPVEINEQARRQFELSWQRGEPANIAEFLPVASDASYAATLEELVHIDIEFRGSQQQKRPGGAHLLLPLTQYIEQFPQLSDPAIIRRLIGQEIHVRRACNLAIEQQQYVRDFGQVVAQTADVDALLVDTKAAFRSTVFKGPDTHEAQTFIPATTDPMKTAMTVLPGIDRTTTMTSVPEQIGNYRLRRQLGAGGMGCVYEAEELGSGQRVALKVILPDLGTSEEAMDRFRQEGQLASGISHPNCVFVLEADQQGEYPYIAMELVKGTDLDEHVRENGPLEILDALRKTIDLIEGLEEAHRLGVIHRDVKPSNCFLTQDGRVKIGDFGLSRTLAEDAQLTMTGSFIGTPLFASPEQIRAEELDDRTDVYSVASTLYFLLTGKAPFHSDNAVSAMARIVADPAPSIREQRPELHRAIASVIHRGLETDRKKRWRSMTDFRNALLQFLPEKRTPVGESLRLVAYTIDLVALSGVYWLLEIGLNNLAVSFSIPFQEINRLFLMVSNLCWVGYFVSQESWSGGTIGKRLLGFRVRSLSGSPLSFLAVLFRTTIVWSFNHLPVLLLPYLQKMASGNPSILILLAVSTTIFPFFILITMRSKNGYRGLHDYWSGAVVVKLPSRSRKKTRIVAVQDISTSLPELTTHGVVLPTTLGPYRIESPIRLTDHELVLDAEDDRVSRNVWIHVRSTNALETSEGRRDVDRPSRLRWLASGQHEERPWDAYLAPEGMPLSHYLKAHGTIDWLATQELLESLAAEIDIAIRDKTFAEKLSPQHVWIRPDGGVVLLDFVVGREENIVTKKEETETQKGLSLLAATAIYCLEGVCPTAEDLEARQSLESILDSQISYRGRKLLARCLDPDNRLESLQEFLQELEETKESRYNASKVTRYRRLKQLIAQLLGLSLWIIGQGMMLNATIYKHTLPEFFLVLSIIPAILLFWTFLTRGGYSMYGSGIMVGKPNGSRASRWRITFRTLVTGLPLLTIMVLVKLFHPEHLKLETIDFWQGTLIVILVVYFMAALLSPRRGLQDLIAGTALVSR